MLLKCILLPLSILCFLIGTGLLISGLILPGILGEAALFAIRDSLVISSKTDEGLDRKQGSYDNLVKLKNEWIDPHYIANLTLEDGLYHYEYVGPFTLQVEKQNVNVSFDVEDDSTFITYRTNKTYTWPNQTDLAKAISDGDFTPGEDYKTVPSWDAASVNVVNGGLLAGLKGAGNDINLAYSLINGTVGAYVDAGVPLSLVIASEDPLSVPISFYNVLLAAGITDGTIKGMYGPELDSDLAVLLTAADPVPLITLLSSYVNPAYLPTLNAYLVFGTAATTPLTISGITAEIQLHASFYLYLTVLASVGAEAAKIGGGVVITETIQEHLLDSLDAPYTSGLKKFRSYYTGAKGAVAKITMKSRNDNSHWELNRINEFYAFTEDDVAAEYSTYPIEGLSLSQFPPSMEFWASHEPLEDSLNETYTVNVMEHFSTNVVYKEDVAAPNGQLKDKLRRYEIRMNETLKATDDTFADCLTERSLINDNVPIYYGEIHYGKCLEGTDEAKVTPYLVNATAAKKASYDLVDTTNYVDVHPIVGRSLNVKLDLGAYVMIDGTAFTAPASLFSSATTLQNFAQYDNVTQSLTKVIVPCGRLRTVGGIKKSDEIKLSAGIELIKFLPKLTPYLTPAGGVLMFVSLLMLYCACKGKKAKSVTAP